MPPRGWQFRCTDIVEAIENIVAYTEGMTYEQFQEDRKTVDAVVRNLIVIGEAARHVPEEVAKAHADIPWREMGDLRNFAVHEYFGIDANVLWATVQDNLPPLVPRIRALIEGGR